MDVKKLIANNAQSSSKLNMGQLLCQQGSTVNVSGSNGIRTVGFGQNCSPESGMGTDPSQTLNSVQSNVNQSSYNFPYVSNTSSTLYNNLYGNTTNLAGLNTVNNMSQQGLLSTASNSTAAQLGSTLVSNNHNLDAQNVGNSYFMNNLSAAPSGSGVGLPNVGNNINNNQVALDQNIKSEQTTANQPDGSSWKFQVL